MTPGADRQGDQALAPAAPERDPGLEVGRLRELLAVAESAIETLRARCEDLEEEKAHLGRLCVASVQLHEPSGEADCLRSLQDVLVNLIGSDQIAIWSLSADRHCLELRASQGVDSAPWRTVAVGEGAVGATAAVGEISVDETAEPGQPTVCIPLRLGRRVLGVVALFGLLAHRVRLAPRDRDVFRLIAQQGAFALCCSGEPWGAPRSGG